MLDGVSLTATTQAATTSTEATGAPVVDNGVNTQATQATTVGADGVSLSQQQQTQPPQTTQTDPAKVAEFIAGLPAEYQELAKAKGWTTHADALKGYKELETKFSSTRPVEAPKSVEEYDISKPDDAEALGYNDDFAKWLKDTGLKHKVGKDTLKGIHDDFLTWARTQAAAVHEAQNAAVTDRVKKAGVALTEAWGAPNNPKFTRALDMSMRAIRQLDPGLKDALIEVGAIVKVGDREMVTNSTIIDAFSKVGAAMYAEDTLYGETAVAGNPFDPKTLDLTKQGQIIRQDKGKAASLIKALSAQDQTRYASILKQLGAQ